MLVSQYWQLFTADVKYCGSEVFCDDQIFLANAKWREKQKEINLNAVAISKASKWTFYESTSCIYISPCLSS